ncbi:potassium voltage-gated channel subfamily A member 7-like isoform X2 [Babylonia areolata]|uniref:potassium voltage-gated channel subfamily A member 7-like isoform X2 n=1 Tax=Babylonia areolata TaxID=304850 RepID=UPI003FD60C07
MNIMTQMYDNNMGHGFNPPVNFHLRPDHFQSDGDDHHSQRRHTLIGDIHDNVSLGSGLRRNSQVSRPLSAALEIPLNLLGSNHRSHSDCNFTRTHSPHRSRSSMVQDEALEQLLPEMEGPTPGSGASEYLSPSCTEYLPLDHDCQLEGCQRAVINVSGLRFETQLRTLDRLPNTLLGDPEKRRRYWDESRQEFFFDRHRPTFQAVLYYYQSGGRLKRPLEVPMDIFLNELMFYELGGPVIDSFKENEGYLVDKSAPEGPRNQTMYKIWTALEYPESSIAAKILAVLSIFFILVSVVVFCTETLPAFKDAGCENVTTTDSEGHNVTLQMPNLEHPIFLTETCCIAYFVIELALRLIVSPSKLVFFRAAINWIDLIAIAPYFVLLIINFVSGDCKAGNKSSALSVLRVLRVVRILKLSKHSEGLKILGMTLKTSIRELSMFVLFLAIATVIFSGAIFYAELDHPQSQFTSIPDAFWWAIVSMTTVGYGDFVPMGVAGKMLGGVCVLSGVLAIALPVPVIVANFNNYYRHYTGNELGQRKSGNTSSA